MNNAYNYQYGGENIALKNNLNFNQQSMNSSTKFDLNDRRRNNQNGENGPSPQEISFDIYGLGEVKYAELHSSANKPLKQLKQPDINMEVCPCCNSYYAVKGYFEPYSFCGNPEDFSNCGQGVVLYYSFLKFIIVVTLIVSLCTCLVNIYYSYNYYDQLTQVCNNIYETQIKGQNNNNAVKYLSCNYYYTKVDEDFEYNEVVDPTFFRFSSVNIKDYRDLSNLINSNKTDIYESTIVNMSRVNFATLIFLFFSNLVFIFFLYNKSNAADYLAFTISDYSVILYNLYDVHGKFLNIKKSIEEKKQECNRTGKQYIPDLYEKKQLGFRIDEINSEIEQFKEFIKKKICKGSFNEDFKINRIDLSYKLGDLKKLQDKLEKKKEKISKVEKFPDFEKKNNDLKLEGDNRKYFAGFLDCGDSDDEQPLSVIKQKKQNIENQINDLIEKSKQNTINYFGGTAFVTFDTIKEQELYMRNVPNNAIAYFIQFMRNMCYIFCSCCVNKSSENIYYLKRNIKFEDAPEPEDILFENLEFSSFSRIVRTFCIYIISILICGVSFVIIMGLNNLQEKIDKENSDGSLSFMYILSLAITVVTSVIDIILEIVFETFTNWEKHTTMTNYYLSYSVKLTIFSFLNSAVLPLISEVLVNKSKGYNVLISNMLMKFLVNAFVSPIMWTLSVSYYLKRIQQCLYKKKILGNKTQKDLNALFELPPMKVSTKYSYIFKTLLMSFLYIPIFPLGVMISFIGFVLAYWLEKINFAAYYKKPEMLNRHLCEFYVSYFVVILFVYGIGDYIFLSDVYDSKVWSLVNIITFGVLIIIPYHRVLSRDFIEFKESNIYTKKYSEAYLNFNIDYERANPMTKQEGEIRFQTERKNRGLISDDEYQKNISSARNIGFDFNRKQNFYGRAFMPMNFIQPVNNNIYNPNNGKPNNIHYNSTIEQNNIQNGNINNNNINQFNNQVNYVQVNNQNSNIYTSQGYYPAQQMNQPVNNKLSFNPVNSNYSRSPGFSSGNKVNNINIYGNNSYIPGSNGYSSHN